MKKAFGGLAVLVVLILVAAALIHPYLAVTAPVECDLAVVEGWIPDTMIPAVKAKLVERGYQRIYTTGTVRPFAYYLKTDERMEMMIDPPQDGGIRINVSGIAGAGFMLLADGDTLLDRAVSGKATDYFAAPKAPIRVLRLISTNTGTPPTELENIYVKHLTVGGMNMHSASTSVVFIGPTGKQREAWPTYAHYAAARLADAGIPPELIIVAPATERKDSRTMANAAGFAIQAERDGVRSFDVISVGIHARRSRKMYRKAFTSEVMIGVIALPDPDVTASNWWKSRTGRMHMLKELAGLPVSSMFGAEE